MNHHEIQTTGATTARRGIQAALALLAICGSPLLGSTPSAAPQAGAQAGPSSSTFTTGSWQVTITDLGLLPGGIYASAYAINDTGKIAGMAYDANGALVTVQWVNGQISVIPGLSPSAASVPDDVNDAGEISGRQLVYSGGIYFGIYWDPQNNAFALSGIPGGPSYMVRAHAINASGQIAGMGQQAGPDFWGHAAVWLKSSFQTDLGFMGGGHFSEAYGINDLGDVVGVAAVANTDTHAFLWQGGHYTDLSTWSGGGASSIAYGINNSGIIVGLNANVASVWSSGAVHALPMPQGVSAYTPAIDVNDAGDIIATGSKGYPLDVGVLWRNGVPIDLGTLPGGTISRARRINAAGEIVGEANAANGFFHAVKWTVTPVLETYCTAKVNSLGCTPAIGWSGTPSASSGSGFLVTATNVLNNKNGLFFYGLAGQQAIPFEGGVLCVKPPIRRTAVQNSGGNPPPNDCSGAFALDFNAYIASGADAALVEGAAFDGQYWSRDPGFAPPDNVGLTDALHAVIGP